MPQKDTSIQKYLNKRQQEFVGRLPVTQLRIGLVGHTFLSENLESSFQEVTPEFTRATDMLECLLLSFIQHATDPASLREMEDSIYGEI